MRSGYLARDVSPGSGKASVDSANLFPFGSMVLQLSLRYHHSHDGINSLESGWHKLLIVPLFTARLIISVDTKAKVE
ncbi:MAG: hypothetical protein QOH63_3614 [Acidobacteriota bacterium]|nr:hypothetical protein [Acidobacteriota bacterium]